MLLTEMACRQAKPRDRGYKMTDGDGMHLFVTPAGAKIWRLAYRWQGKQKTCTFGGYPAIGLADARQMRSEARKGLALGIDPQAAQRARKMAPTNTFKALAAEWFEIQKKAWEPEQSLRVEGRLVQDVYPAIGDMAVEAIEPPDVLQIVRAIEGRGAIDVARRVKGHIGAVFRYGISTGRAKRDPTADLRGALAKKPRVKHMAALSTKELPAFMIALEHYEGEELTKLALEFIVRTAVRSNETRFATWGELENLGGENPLWRIPAHRMKKHREHLVPLTPRCVDILERAHAIGCESPYIFSGQRPGKPMSMNTVLYALYRLGYRGRATVHGFRGSFSTAANESGLWRSDAVGCYRDAVRSCR